MKHKTHKLLPLIFIFLLSGCNLLATPQVDENQIATQSALIIQQAAQATATAYAMETEMANIATKAALLGATFTPTFTAVPPSSTPLPTSTLPPTQTPLPSFTPFPTFTPIPTATPVPCNRAGFVADVTIPDGTIIPPGATFTKVWRLKNNGTCTWNTNYSVVFSGGDRMGGASPTPLTANVAPGETIDISITFTAPTTEGKYRSNWKLRAADGTEFGLGSRNSAFYVDIEVKSGTSAYPFDFVLMVCSAEWSSGAGTLPCPGTDGDAKGFVLVQQKPQLESGVVDDEPALITQPQAITDGTLRGKFPGYKVQTGDKFKAIIGCSYNYKSCDMRFQLDYQIGSDPIQTLAYWNEVYDETFHSVEVDLSPLNGKTVRFILTVLANGEMKQDRGIWLAPRIVR
ncbi:MAG: NBR1-Ig-like domain-containing protein [Anaerolinea sp.]